MKRSLEFLAIFILTAAVLGCFELLITWLKMDAGIDNAAAGFMLVFLLSAAVAAIGYGVLWRMGSLSEERKRADEGRKESEERYRNLYLSSRDAIMTLEPPLWKFISGNPATVQMFMAKDEAEFTSQEPWALSPKRQPDGRESGEKAREMIETALHAGTHFFKWTHRRFNGEDFPATVLLSRTELAGKVFLQATVRDITGQKRAEDALRESESFNRELVENLPEHIAIYGADGKFLFVNTAVTSALGYSEEEIIGTSVLSYIAEEYRETVIAHMDARREGRKVPPYEIDVLSRDGHRISVIIKGTPLSYHNTPAMLLVLTDITERKRAEATLAESELRFRTVFDATPDGLLLADPATCRFVMANHAIQMQLGYTEAELLGLPVSDTSLSVDLPRVIGPFKKFIRREVVVTTDLPVTRKDGTILYADIRTSTISLGDRQYVLIISHDVEERKTAEDALRETNEYLRNLLDYANAPIIVWDTEFRITRFNHAFERLTGRSEQDVISQHLSLLFPEAGREASLGHIQKTLAGERWDVVEIPILHVSGEIRTVLWNSAYIVDPRGTIISTIAQGQDITERKMAENQLRTQLNEKEHLLSEIHHQVTKSLQMALSAMEQEQRRQPDEQVQAVMIRTGDRLAAISFAFDRVHLSGRKMNVQFRDVVRAIISRLYSMYPVDSKRIVISVPALDLEPGIDLAVPLALMANELVTNAIRHAFLNGRSGTIILTGSDDGHGLITLTVRDNGTGLPKGFNPAESDTIGFTLVYSMVKQIGGMLSYTSSGEGTCFTLTVPNVAEQNHQE